MLPIIVCGLANSSANRAASSGLLIWRGMDPRLHDDDPGREFQAVSFGGHAQLSTWPAVHLAPVRVVGRLFILGVEQTDHFVVQAEIVIDALMAIALLAVHRQMSGATVG